MATKNEIGTTKPGEVSFGFTGAASFTADSVLVGNGTSPVTALATSTNGATLIGATAAAPAFNTIIGGANISVNNAANSITINYTGSGGGGSVTSWTPSMKHVPAPCWPVDQTYSVQTGKYVTIGKLIFYFGQMTLTSRGTNICGSPQDDIEIIGLTPLIDAGLGTLNCQSFVAYNTTFPGVTTGYCTTNARIGNLAVTELVPRSGNSSQLTFPGLTNTSRFRFMGIGIIF